MKKPQTSVGLAEELGNRATLAGANKPIWEIVSGLGEKIPFEAWISIPTDASVNLDHYVYGTPKEEA